MMPSWYAFIARREGQEEGKCVCGCHIEAWLKDKTPRPKADEQRLCQPCADERFTPWTDRLESLAR